MECFFLGGPADRETLIAVGVEGVEGIGMVHRHVEEGIALVCCWHRLLLNGSAHDLNELAERSCLLLADSLIHGMTLDEMLLPDSVCPAPERRVSPAFFPIANSYAHVEITGCYVTIDRSISFCLNSRKYCDCRPPIIQFLFLCIMDMLADGLHVPTEKFCRLLAI